MAEIKFRMKRKKSDGTFDIYHPETVAENVKMTDGSTVETKVTSHLAEYTNMISARNGINANAIINGNFDIGQRGTSFTNPVSGAYLADRFYVAVTSSGVLPTTLTHSQLTLTSGDILNAFYGYRLNTNGSGSGFGVSDQYSVRQKIEHGTRYLCGAGKKITLSFWAKSDIVGKRIGVSAEQRYGSGGSPSANEILQGQIFTLTTVWTKYTFTFSTNTLVGKTFGTSNDDTIFLIFNHMWGTTTATSLYGGGTAETFVGAGNIDIAQVQLCAGDTDLPFQPRSYDEELALCQRYYEKSYAIDTPPASVSANGSLSFQTRTAISASVAGNLYNGEITFKTRKRTTPTVTLYSPDTGVVNAIRNASGSNDRTGATVDLQNDSALGRVVISAASPNAISLDHVIRFHWTADAEL